MWEIESTGYMTSKSTWYKLFGRNINRDIDNHKLITFKDNQTQEKRIYAPYQTCYNIGNDILFICSSCGAFIRGTMLDDFDDSINYSDGASYCGNCGARIIR